VEEVNNAFREAAKAARWKGILKVTDDEIVEAYKALAALEGVFCEPASAASVAGLKKYASHHSDFAQSDETVACILTGHGLKDPDRALASMSKPKTVAASMDVILKELKLSS